MTDCLLIGTVQKNGYAYVPHRGKSRLAHRVAWECENGSIPGHLEVHHLCGNRACSNVEHLELVTRKDHRALHRTCDHEDRYMNVNGGSVCRTCRREYVREWQRRHRAKKKLIVA